MRRATIYSVAQACGVSSSTVSRAFSRPDLVRDDVRRQILDTAASMGYRPNRSARATATGRTAMLGLVVPDITNPFMPPLVRAVQHAATEIDCSVVLVDAEESTAAEEELLSQLRGQVDGLVLAAPRAPARVLRQAAQELPCALINREVRDLPSVVWDTTTALSAIGDRLTELGHRVVCLLTGPPASWAAKRRAEAIRRWAGTAGVALVERGPFDASFAGGREAAKALLDTDATAAFAFDDVTACGVLAELASQGVRVPGDRSVIGCDDVLLARMVTPALTTVTAPVGRLGAIAVDLVRERIDDAATRPGTHNVDGAPAFRDSIAPPPSSSSP